MNFLLADIARHNTTNCERQATDIPQVCIQRHYRAVDGNVLIKLSGQFLGKDHNISSGINHHSCTDIPVQHCIN